MSRAKLKRIIQETDTRAGRTFDWSVQFLIIFSIVVFSIETLPDLNEKTLRLLRYIEYITVGLFTIEYVLRILVATPRRNYIFSVWGIIDIAAILPTYLAIGVDLCAIRALRLLRLFRLIKLARYTKAIDRYRSAFLKVREELIIFGATMLVLLYLTAVGIYYFERDAQPEHFSSIFSSLWWAVITLTTVGYGDAYPITVGGRIFTFGVLIIGLGIVAVPSGLIASALTQAIREEKDVTSGRTDKP